MKIYSYFVNVPELTLEDEWRLVHLWRRNWESAGFEPIVLNEWHARQHTMFAAYDQAISALPSSNPKDYEKACWLRWLALAAVGGGFMADYDVFAYETAKKDASRLLTKISKGQVLIMFQERAPSLCYASKAIAERMCLEFMSGKWGNAPQGERPHFSDQYALEQLAGAGADWIERRHDVKAMGDEGWEKSLFVHYPNDPMTRAGKIPKWRHVNNLRK
jgi:hypothetical protein